MSGLVIEKEKCVGCGACVSACPSAALSMEGGLAAADGAACVLCGVCVDTCPTGAISVEKEEAACLDPSDWRDVWVFAQWEGESFHPVTLELLSRGRALADGLGERLCAAAVGCTEADCAPLLDQGADVVYLCPALPAEYRMEPFCAAVLSQLAQERKPGIMLFGATPFGRSLAPRLAARLGTGLTADCTQLDIDGESRCLRQTRPAFGGNLMATIVCPTHRPQMATVRPGVFPILTAGRRTGAEIVTVEPPVLPPPLTRELAADQAVQAAAGLRGAQVIVSVGRGIGVRKNVKLVERLAELLGAQVGCSRPLVEAGWLSYDHQIGQTGVSVAPKLLITFGISGAIQHLAGIAGAERIIAVNSDPSAPIFAQAHEAVVGDCVEILEEMIKILEKKPN